MNESTGEEFVDPELSYRIMEMIHERFYDYLFSRVVPIVAMREQDREPEFAGTGSLLQVADTTFLVTASHVLETRKYGYALGVPTRDGTPHDLNGNYGHLDSETPHDVGVVTLEPALAKLLLSDFRSLRMSDIGWITPEGAPSRALYVLFGYPHSEVRSTDSGIAASPRFSFVREFRGKAALPLATYDASFNLLLHQPDASGESSTLVDQKSMSGAPVWQVATLPIDVDRIADWTPAQAAVVGLQVSTHQSKRVKAATWVSVLQLLKIHSPELAPAIRIPFPDLAVPPP